MSELYLGLDLVSTVENEVIVVLPVQSTAYPGKLGRIQTLLRNRYDPLSKEFSKLYIESTLSIDS